jgi:hypothetical protein
VKNWDQRPNTKTKGLPGIPTVQEIMRVLGAQFQEMGQRTDMYFLLYHLLRHNITKICFKNWQIKQHRICIRINK